MRYSLIALVIGLAGVLEIAGVLDGDVVADIGLAASALLVDSLGDTHDEVS
jgi:hypothetical protein